LRDKVEVVELREVVARMLTQALVMAQVEELVATAAV
jgi:hypothetical protein